MEQHNLIKKTESLCPVCLAKIDASVYEEAEKAVMRKTCMIHGEFSSIMENDINFYRKALSIGMKEPIKGNFLIIPITYKCNIACTYCYLPFMGKKDPSMEAIKSMVEHPQYPVIIFSGGESNGCTYRRTPIPFSM